MTTTNLSNQNVTPEKPTTTVTTTTEEIAATKIAVTNVSKGCCSAKTPTNAQLLEELQLVECYLNSMSLDIPMLNAAKSEREWDWFFHKLEEGFLVAEVEQDNLKLKLAKRFMRGRQLLVWCSLIKESEAQESQYEIIRDKMYDIFFPQSDYYNSLMELFGGFRENGNESPRRKMSLVGVKLVIGTAKETMQRVSKRYNRDMPPEAFWYQFALRLMTPAVKELFDSKLVELLPPKETDNTGANTASAETATEEGAQNEAAKDGEGGESAAPAEAIPTAAVIVYPDIHIEHMLNSIKDPNPRSMRAPHKFRRTARKSRPHGTNAGKKAASGGNSPTNATTGAPNSASAKNTYPSATAAGVEN